MPGLHGEIIEEPHVRVLAAKLRVCLDKAQAATAASPLRGGGGARGLRCHGRRQTGSQMTRSARTKQEFPPVDSLT